MRDLKSLLESATALDAERPTTAQATAINALARLDLMDPNIERPFVCSRELAGHVASLHRPSRVVDVGARLKADCGQKFDGTDSMVAQFYVSG